MMMMLMPKKNTEEDVMNEEKVLFVDVLFGSVRQALCELYL
jgi:hypothetical protein